MKKNYTKPTLLSESFIAENIMSSMQQKKVLSNPIDLYLNGQKTFTGISFTEDNTLNTISVNDFNK